MNKQGSSAVFAFLALAGLGVPLFTIPQSSPLPAALLPGSR